MGRILFVDSLAAGEATRTSRAGADDDEGAKCHGPFFCPFVDLSAIAPVASRVSLANIWLATCTYG
jgi:hypothetical protein